MHSISTTLNNPGAGAPALVSVLPRFLLIWLSLLALLALALGLFYRSQSTAGLRLAQASQREALGLSQQVIESQLNTVRADLLFLADQARPPAVFSQQAARARLAQVFLDFAGRKNLYAQISLLDQRGQELIRVHSSGGEARLMPQNALSNRALQPYFPAAYALSAEQIYLSPFDLTADPLSARVMQPVLRVATPSYDSARQKRGILVINYLAQLLLSRLRAFSSSAAGSVWLINDAGYWILGDHALQEWAWLYPERAAQRFSSLHPVAWSKIQAGEVVQFQTTQGIYSYSILYPERILNGGNPPQGVPWILVNFLPRDALVSQQARLLREVLFIFAALAALFAAITWVVVGHRLRRAQAEATIRSNEALFRNLLESAPDAIIIVARDGRIELVNTQVENAFGYTRAELVGQSVDILVPQRLRNTHPHHRERYFTQAEARPMGLGLALSGQRKDGSEFPVEISLSPLHSDQALRVIAVIRDMSAHREAERARAEVQQRYRDLVNNLPVGVYRKTPGATGNFLEVNPAMVSMFEAGSAEELLRHPVSDIHLNSASRLALSDKVIREGHVNQEEMQFVTLKGRVFWGAITAAVQQDAAGNIFFDGLIEDISVRRAVQEQVHALNLSLQSRTEALEAANAELESFSYSVSHDLRAPLRAIDGFARILLAQAARLDEKGQDYLQRMRRAAQNMGLLIDDLLNLSRLTRHVLQMDNVDMTNLAQAIIAELRRQEPERRVNFLCADKLLVQGDKRLLNIALTNLLSNAWKFTGERAQAEISFTAQRQGQETVYCVRDNGAGFDMEYAGKLFGAFQRLHDASEFPGTGIGLATVQRVIRKHGGRIWAEAAVDQGAAFFFTLATETI